MGPNPGRADQATGGAAADFALGAVAIKTIPAPTPTTATPKPTVDTVAARYASSRSCTPRGVQTVYEVHCFFESSDLWGAPVARLCGLPVISSRRDMGIHRHGLHNLLYRFVSPLFSEVQAVSEEVRQWLIRRDRLSPERVVTMPNGIDLTAFRPSESPAGLRQDEVCQGNFLYIVS